MSGKPLRFFLALLFIVINENYDTSFRALASACLFVVINESYDTSFFVRWL